MPPPPTPLQLVGCAKDDSEAERAGECLGAVQVGLFEFEPCDVGDFDHGIARPSRDDATATDTVTEDVLRLFGLAADEAKEICRRPLADLEGFALPDSA